MALPRVDASCMDFSAGGLATGFLVSTVGMGFFMYGKKQARVPQLVAGLLLMIYPGFMTSPTWSMCIAAAVLGALWGVLRFGL